MNLDDLYHAKMLGDKDMVRHLELEQRQLDRLQDAMEAKDISFVHTAASADTSMAEQGPWGPNTGATTPVTHTHTDPVVAAKLDMIVTLLRELRLDNANRDHRNMLVGVAATVEEAAKGTTEAVLALAAQVEKGNQLLEEIAEGLRLAVER